jgi:hypothetical protein
MPSSIAYCIGLQSIGYVGVSRFLLGKNFGTHSAIAQLALAYIRKDSE